jgi:hypothetical protein
VSSCRSRAWLGRLNGALLDDMAESGLRVLVTADTLLWSQHRARIERLGLSVVLVRDPRSVMGRAAAIAVAVRAVAPGAQHEVPAP